MTPDDDSSPPIPRTPSVEALSGDTKARADSNRARDHATPDALPGTVARTPSDVARQEEDARAKTSKTTVGRVGRFELIAVLGEGGMGTVFKAQDSELERVVALKIVKDINDINDIARERFLNEARAMAAIHHDNVAKVLEVGTDGALPFIVMEFCSGGTLGRLLPVGRVQAKFLHRMAALIAKVAHGVAAAHAQGVIHRDLKPGNVLLDANGTPKVTDFGIAKMYESAGQGEDNESVGRSLGWGASPDLTQVGEGMGTPTYMAPEQAHDAKYVGPQADVWALGVMLYEALTGERPFTGSVQEVLVRIQNADPTPPSQIAPAIPRDLEQICLKCLAKQAHERYPTAREVADALDRHLRGEPIDI